MVADHAVGSVYNISLDGHVCYEGVPLVLRVLSHCSGDSKSRECVVAAVGLCP